MGFIKRLFKLTILLGLLGAGLLFLWIDSKVAEHIVHEGLNSKPAILSAPMALNKDLPLTKAALLKELSIRRYSSKTKKLDKPGDYIVSDTHLDMFLRSFTLPKGEQAEARKVRYNLTDRSVIDLDRGAVPNFPVFLEPVTLSQLGAGNIRVASFTSLDTIPKSVKQAVIAIEDQRFYSHIGLDFIGIARAMASNLKAGRIVQGGSTLTQQLAKNLLFTRRKTLTRKALEALAAISLELRLTKKQILELYLNEVYLGQEGSFALHGVESAARAFFQKKAEDLTLPEAALIAGIIQAPSSYSPRRYASRAKSRRNTVLEAMKNEGYLTAEQARKAKSSPLQVSKERNTRRTAPYFLEALRKDLSQYIDYDAGVLNGMRIYTGLVPAIQNCAERSIREGLADIASKHPKIKKQQSDLQAALVALSPYNGIVRAWVGGKNYRQNQYDRVWQSTRQIGSTVKPFLYLTALDGTLNTYRVATTRSILSDRPVTIEVTGSKDWTPQNYTKRFVGDVTLRYALEHSLNIPAVYVAQRIGVESLARTLQAFHVSENPPAVPSLALGSAETSLLNLTAGYAALANGGKYIAPRLFFTARDSRDQQMVASLFDEEIAADENAVYVLTNILQGVIERGTARSVRRLGFERAAAGKTGTTNDARDAWFVGYTPTLTAGVWIGFDDNRKLGLTGGSAAAPIWSRFMKCSQTHYSDLSFVRPPGVVGLKIDATTGQLTSDRCRPDNAITEIYVRGTEPTQYCGYDSIRQYERPPSQRMVDELDRAHRPKRRRKSFWDTIFGN